jgi:hypothetical protein
MSTATTKSKIRETIASILARVLCDEDDQLPPELARHIMEREFSERDKARMQDLARRNQQGTLSPDEREELFAFADAGTVLAIFKSRARRTLKVKPKTRRTT